MEVSHSLDHISHAVIGGGKALDFSISNSPEFFQILSSTLYTDQILAVVRETICNAWDAHIASGKTDIPIKIEIDSEQFSVEDYGLGIKHSDIGPIYATYGNSTKKNDGEQTGGFGLGCKAPFAYTDHFEVVSSHEGIKTIYNMSKSNAQVNGKPGVITIASFPTTEVGIRVKIQLKEGKDFSAFMARIEEVIQNGGINATVNGNKSPTYDYNQLETMFFLTKKKPTKDRESIFVKYGNVIYPVPAHESYNGHVTQIANWLCGLQSNYHEYYLVMIAEPNSLSVTPSRETLSLQEHTIESLNKLFVKMNYWINHIRSIQTKQAQALIEKAVEEKKYAALLSRNNELPGNAEKDSPNVIWKVEDVARRALAVKYPSGHKFRIKDLVHRARTLAKAGFVDRGRAACFIDDIEKTQTEFNQYNWRRPNNLWLQKRVIAPLIMKLKAAGLQESLYIMDSLDHGMNLSRNEKREIMPAVQCTGRHSFINLPFLRKIIILTFSRNDMQSRYTKWRFHNDTSMHVQDGILVYQVSRKKGGENEAITFFKRLGYEIINLCVKQAWEVEKEDIRPKVKGPTPKKGVPTLSAMVKQDKSISLSYAKLDTAKRIQNPEFVFLAPIRGCIPDNTIYPFDALTTKAIIELFGDRGGLAANTNQYNVYTRKGAMSAKEFLSEQLHKKIIDNKDFVHFFANSSDKLQRVMNEKRNYDYDHEFLKLIFDTPEIMREFNITQVLSDNDRKYWKIFQSIDRHYRNDDKIMEIDKLYRDTPLSKDVLALKDLLVLNPERGLIFNAHKLKNLMYKDRPRAIEVILKSLKG